MGNSYNTKFAQIGCEINAPKEKSEKIKIKIIPMTVLGQNLKAIEFEKEIPQF